MIVSTSISDCMRSIDCFEVSNDVQIHGTLKTQLTKILINN